MTTFLFALREAARTCRHPGYRFSLQYAADELAGRIQVFANEATRENMKDLNGTWAKAERLMANIPEENEPTSPTRMAA